LVSLKKKISVEQNTLFGSTPAKEENNAQDMFDDKNAPEKTKKIQNKILLTEAAKTATYGILKERFVLESILGAGGMGIVYKTKDLLKVEAKDRNPYIAIKVLSDEFKVHPEAFIALQRESHKSQSIAHPNIVNVYDFDRDGDTVFMTMEYMDGQPLDQLIRKYRAIGMPSDEAWSIIKGMSAALLHAHSEKIVHSDFKPGNVFVTKKGIAKVFDFGIARAVKIIERKEVSHIDKTLFDAASLGALTPAYASFEMLKGEEPDIRDDIFALGCVAYELLTGMHPYKKIPADEAAKKNIKPKRINHISNRQWRAIEKAIELKRENRLSTVEEFIDGITPKAKTLTWLFVGLLLMLFVGGGAFIYMQNKALNSAIETNNKVNIGLSNDSGVESEFELMVDVELLKDIKATKKRLRTLLFRPVFMSSWEDKVWESVSDLLLLVKTDDPWLENKVNHIYDLYIKEITRVINQKKYTEAKLLIKNAKHYTHNYDELDFKLYEMLSDLETVSK